jgi:predicted nucleic acid-binding protein
MRSAGPVVVIDASTMVDLLLDTPESETIRSAVRDRPLAVPAHFDAEVLSAIGRLQRSGDLSESASTARIAHLAAAPIDRHPLAPLLVGAWARRDDTRLVDALYLELASTLDTFVLTTDRRLARAHPAAARTPGEIE